MFRVSKFSTLSNEKSCYYNFALVSLIMTSTTYRILKYYLSFHFTLLHLLYLKHSPFYRPKHYNINKVK